LTLEGSWRRLPSGEICSRAEILR